MKKTLAVIGILICAAGVVWADETASADLTNAVTQQVEVQNKLDRTNFENAQKYEKFNRSLNTNDKKDKIKFDKTVNDKKYKNFDKKKGSYQKYPSRITDKRYDKSFQRELPDRYVGRKPLPRSEFRPHHPRHHHYVHNAKAPKTYNNIRRSSYRNSYRRG